jgi:probable F420-dependent oxidoreductase
VKLDAAFMTGDLARAGELAAALEAQGHDGLYSFEGPHDPFFPLVLAAQATSRIELATGVAIAFARTPMLCAQIAQDLQRLSRGRFILGLGTQIRAHVEKRFSMPWSRPAARMREFVLAIRAIWRSWSGGERLEFRGEFYTHTLMTPMFSPGKPPFGDPRIFLAAVGPRMVEVCGEVADGYFVHPLNTPGYLRDVSLPALARGLAAGGRTRAGFEVAAQTIVCIGANDAQLARARDKARAQIAFYGSTPAYAGVLEHCGREALFPELNRMTKEGRWAELPGRVDDELLDAIAVSGTPAEAGRKLRERCAGLVERVGLGLYNEAGPDAVVDLLKAARAAA